MVGHATDTLGFSDDLQHLVTFAAALCAADDIDIVQHRAPEVIHRGHTEVSQQLRFDLGLYPDVVDPLVDALLAVAIGDFGLFAAAVAERGCMALRRRSVDQRTGMDIGNDPPSVLHPCVGD